jgi:hypothetical protein
MKTTNIVLILALLTFATAGIAKSDHLQFSVTISLSNALQNHGLVAAMHDQLNPGFLHHYPNRVYTAKVNYKHTIYVIKGTYQEWKDFFFIDNIDDLITSAKTDLQTGK